MSEKLTLAGIAAELEKRANEKWQQGFLEASYQLDQARSVVLDLLAQEISTECEQVTDEEVDAALARIEEARDELQALREAVRRAMGQIAVEVAMPECGQALCILGVETGPHMGEGGE